jgi:ATPase subunit of ABC transporter with duplicated ATPase domains
MESDLAWAVISHDRGFLERTCTKLLRLADGRLAEV